MDRKKNHQHYIYRCIAKYTMPTNCNGCSIREEVLIDTVVNEIIKYSNALTDDSSLRTDKKQRQAELVQMQVESSNEEDVLRLLYEELAQGKISQTEFQELKERNGRKIAKQKERWVQLMGQQADQQLVEAEWRKLSAILDEFKISRNLSAELVNGLIKQVEVYRDGQIYVGFIERTLNASNRIYGIK